MTTPTMYRYCTKEDDGLTEGAYCSCTAGYEIYACFFLFSILCLCSANSGPLDNNTTEGIATKFMTKCCSYYGVNESVHFNNV